MIRICIILGLIVLGFFLLSKPQKNSLQKLKQQLKKLSPWLIGGFFILLIATGKLNGLLALIAAVILAFGRVLPLLLRYIDSLQPLWTVFNNQQSAKNQQRNSSFSKADMSREEAYEVLGLTADASETEITLAHRRLMQKIHPDRGGSDYLAAKINRAKAVLLDK